MEMICVSVKNNKCKINSIKNKDNKKNKYCFVNFVKSNIIKKRNDNKSKETYNNREVAMVVLFSLIIGFIMCFICMSMLIGKNYLIVVRDLGKVVDTYYAIVDNYYGDLDKDKLVDSAVNGMISSVGDVFTSYTDANDTEQFDEKINGSYEGIGCSVATYSDGSIVIMDVFEDSPSDKAGLKVGDIVIKVDDEILEGKNSSQLSDYIKKSNKEKLILTVIRDNAEIEVVVYLGKVEIPYVSGEVIDKDNKKIGYIKISLFASNSYNQFKNKLEELEKEGIDSLVIDVRDNNGGYLSSVTDICNLFLEKGKIIYQLEDSKGINKKKDTTKAKRKYDVVVLVNGGSASASEILATAISESYGGYIVGTKSYGKGTVQETKKLLDGSMIKYTTQKWLTPLGNSIDGIGVTPDIICELNTEYYDSFSHDVDNQLQEAIKLLIK